jgi:signal transduction histidine kinase
MSESDHLTAMFRAFESAGLATWVWDPVSDRATETNIEKLYGLEPGTFDHRYNTFLDLLHPDDRARVEAETAEAIRSRDALHLEFRVVLPDGGVRWIASIGSIERQDGQVTLRGICMNITDKKALESRQLHSARLESIGTLAGGIAHDLNNVLTPIRLGADLLRHITDEAKRQTLLDSMTFSVNRGVELLAQIVDFARGREAAFKPLAPGPILKAVGRLLEHTLPRSVVLEVSAPHDLGHVRGDTTQLSQVLVNLAINARDAMPGGGRLSLSAANVTLDEAFARGYPGARAGRHVCLTVADTGCGMPPAVLERIFDPFFTTKAVGQGTGLGLSTVRGIVQRHAGFLDVESTPGHGTTFRIWLPVTDEPGSEPAGEPALFKGRQQLILVVDDEAGVRGLVREVLESNGYQVLTAANGAEALVAFNQHPRAVDAVIVDLLMPVLDGLTTIRALRQNSPDVPILPASGLPPAPEALGELKLPVFLPKPFTAKGLLQSLRALLPATPPE